MRCPRAADDIIFGRPDGAVFCHLARCNVGARIIAEATGGPFLAAGDIEQCFASSSEYIPHFPVFRRPSRATVSEILGTRPRSMVMCDDALVGVHGVVSCKGSGWV